MRNGRNLSPGMNREANSLHSAAVAQGLRDEALKPLIRPANHVPGAAQGKRLKA